jgi:hypothetical protein
MEHDPEPDPATAGEGPDDAPRLPQLVHKLWPGVVRCVNDPRLRTDSLVLITEMHVLIGDNFLTARFATDVWPAVCDQLQDVVAAAEALTGGVISARRGGDAILNSSETRAVRTSLALLDTLAHVADRPLRRIAAEVAGAAADVIEAVEVAAALPAAVVKAAGGEGPAMVAEMRTWAASLRDLVTRLESQDADATYLTLARLDKRKLEPPIPLPACMRPSPLESITRSGMAWRKN